MSRQYEVIFIEVCLADPRNVWKCFFIPPLLPPQNTIVSHLCSLFTVAQKAEMELGRGGGGGVKYNQMGFLHPRFPLQGNGLCSKIL